MCIALLIADPDDVLRQTLADYLSLQGFATQQAASADESAHLLVSARPSVVLLEPELLAGTSIANAPNVPIVVLTRHTDPAAAESEWGSVVSTFTKPAGLLEIANSLRAAASNHLSFDAASAGGCRT